MGYTQLGSREYKVMLERSQFGSADELEADAQRFWSALRARPAARTGSGATIGDELELPEEFVWKRKTDRQGRPVQFFDDDVGSFRALDYVLRRRGKGKERKITLKRRSSDRVLACSKQIDRGMAAHNRPRKKDKVERKFEEDIKVADDSSGQGRSRQRSLFGLSVDLEGRGVKDVSLDSVGDVDALFPGFASAVDLPADTLLTPLRDEVTEHVLEVDEPLLFLGDDEDATGAALVAWYVESSDTPCVVEFSYKHEDDETDFDAGVARRCQMLLMTLDGLDAWRPPLDERLTKTAWVYQNSRLADPSSR